MKKYEFSIESGFCFKAHKIGTGSFIRIDTDKMTKAEKLEFLRWMIEAMSRITK